MNPNIERRLPIGQEAIQAHQHGRSLLEWAVWHNDYAVVNYLLKQPNINPKLVKFTVRGGKYFLSGKGFPFDREVYVFDCVVSLIEEFKNPKRVKNDIHNLLFGNEPLDYIYYSDDKHLVEFAHQYSEIVQKLFEGFNGNHFKVAEIDDIASIREAELDKVRKNYQDLISERLGINHYVVKSCEYTGIHPLINIKFTSVLNHNQETFEDWIRGLRIDPDGHIYVDKIEMILQDDYHPTSTQKLILCCSIDGELKIDCPELGESRFISL